MGKLSVEVETKTALFLEVNDLIILLTYQSMQLSKNETLSLFGQ